MEQQGNPCLTIALNTHRHHPENQQDRIHLKNLQNKAIQEMEAKWEKSVQRAMEDRLDRLTREIDHEANLDSMLVFIHPDFAQLKRLPIPVINRVAMGERFYIRDLFRTLQLMQKYYVLVLSRDKARLLKGSMEALEEEVRAGFPFENEGLFTTDTFKLSTQKGQDNLIEEFFNRVDKQFQEVWLKERLPLVVCTEERNFFHYEKMADRKNLIIGHLNMNRLEEKADSIIRDAWPIAKAYNQAKHADRISELKRGVSAGNAFSDLNDIWKHVQEGRGQLLFLQEDYLQPAVEENGRLAVLPPGSELPPGADPDILDRLMEMTYLLGGEIIFTDQKALADFQGLGLVGR
jgi:hypothetical protein